MPQINWKTGVYRWRNTVNGKVYVGSAARGLDGRKWSHQSRLRRGVHGNKHLQRAWDRYGEAAFAWEVLERCAPKDCVTREQFWIDRLGASDRSRGYNVNPTAGSMLGFRHSEETKALVGSKGRGRTHTADARRRIAEGNRVAKLGNTYFKGKKHSEETRSKIAGAARRQWQSSQHRSTVTAKNRETARRQWADPAYREKHRKAMLEWAKRRAVTCAEKHEAPVHTQATPR